MIQMVSMAVMEEILHLAVMPVPVVEAVVREERTYSLLAVLPDCTECIRVGTAEVERYHSRVSPWATQHQGVHPAVVVVVR